jgi:hypothetical protein
VPKKTIKAVISEYHDYVASMFVPADPEGKKEALDLARELGKGSKLWKRLYDRARKSRTKRDTIYTEVD